MAGSPGRTAAPRRMTRALPSRPRGLESERRRRSAAVPGATPTARIRAKCTLDMQRPLSPRASNLLPNRSRHRSVSTTPSVAIFDPPVGKGPPAQSSISFLSAPRPTIQAKSSGLGAPFRLLVWFVFLTLSPAGRTLHLSLCSMDR